MSRVTLLRLVCAAAISAVAAEPILAGENPLVVKANTWRHGEPIADELLRFRESDNCIADESDTVAVFDRITNYDLLRAILLQRCDDGVFECAFKRGLALVGPSRFFRDTEAMYAALPQLLSQVRHRNLQERCAIPHVAVDGIFVDDDDMSREQADSVFAQIAAELRAGKPFDEVQKKYYGAYEYAYTKGLPDGERVVLHRTRIGNYGNFVVSDAEHTARPFRLADLPPQHVRPLLRGRTGDIIILRDEAEHRSILYRVRDAYSPKKTSLGGAVSTGSTL